MNHLTLRGTHREMGFQRGARLAERGLRLLDHVPFPLEAERRAFAAACHPAYARHFPAALEELEGLAAEEIQLLMVEQVLVEAAAARIDHMVTNHIDHTVDQLDTVVQE